MRRLVRFIWRRETYKVGAGRTENSIRAAVEAILFACGGAVGTKELAHALELETDEMENIMKRAALRYEEEDRGIRLTELDGAWQLCTKTEYYGDLINVVKQPKKPVLTDVVLETLAIVAYRQPVTRIEIEKIRGVRSDHAVNRLLEYGLIEERGRLDAPGRPAVFGTTEEFLRCFGLSTLEDLPKNAEKAVQEVLDL